MRLFCNNNYNLLQRYKHDNAVVPLPERRKCLCTDRSIFHVLVTKKMFAKNRFYK